MLLLFLAGFLLLKIHCPHFNRWKEVCVISFCFYFYLFIFLNAFYFQRIVSWEAMQYSIDCHLTDIKKTIIKNRSVRGWGIRAKTINWGQRQRLELCVWLCASWQSGTCPCLPREGSGIGAPEVYMESSEVFLPGMSTFSLEVFTTPKRSNSKAGKLWDSLSSTETLVSSNRYRSAYSGFTWDAYEWKCSWSTAPRACVPSSCSGKRSRWRGAWVWCSSWTYPLDSLQMACGYPVRSITACTLQNDGPIEDTFITTHTL